MKISFLKDRAKARLNGNWEQAIIAIMVATVIFFVIDGFFGDKYLKDNLAIFCLRIFLQAPAFLGMAIVFLSISRDQNPRGTEVFQGFHNWWNAFKTMIVMIFFIILWSILLIIPGIMAALSYSMSFYILADNPDMKPGEILRHSKNLMRGHKTELLLLILSFTGWLFLSVITAGILYLLYTGPFFQSTLAEFYESLQERSDF
ncbi:MAG: DUF975 family protein [Candidatus Cloacimonetes bacterium]|nr:DUF975 family protein [Candidatus Cloacimonadota bacterium]